jgi:hypothetical protein
VPAVVYMLARSIPSLKCSAYNVNLIVPRLGRFTICKSARARSDPPGRARQGRVLSAAQLGAVSFAPNRRFATLIVCCINTLPATAFAGMQD